MRLVIWFLNAKNGPAEIQRQLTDVYSDSAMEKGSVRKWCQLFRGSRNNMHNNELSGRTNISSGEYSGTFHSVSKLHQVIITCVWTSKNVCPVADWGVVQRKKTCRIVSKSWRRPLCRWHTTAVPTIWHVPYFTWQMYGVVVQWRQQHVGIKINILWVFPTYLHPRGLTFWARYIRILLHVTSRSKITKHEVK
jgi:hypothetical protein